MAARLVLCPEEYRVAPPEAAVQHPLAPLINAFIEQLAEQDHAGREQWLTQNIAQLVDTDALWIDGEGHMRLHPEPALDALTAGILAVLLRVHDAQDLTQRFDTIRHLVDVEYARLWQRMKEATQRHYHGMRRLADSSAKRLPEEAVAVLRDWFDRHIFAAGGPYPDNEEKDVLLLRTGLDIAAIDTWFTNMRRRDKFYLENCRAMQAEQPEPF